MAVSTERFRIVEPLFQPHLIGDLRSAGLVETVFRMLHPHKHDGNLNLKAIRVHGGFAEVPGILERLQVELEAVLPSGSMPPIQHIPYDRGLNVLRAGLEAARIHSDTYALKREWYQEHGLERATTLHYLPSNFPVPFHLSSLGTLQD